ncbi:KTSC domain-containing protein [Mucilaginibacter flavidus]|uniref:KTSC domain-containing protein n=1 Tax=Mucilaginibacter flavidus TaxID=2949309 RepID=UPI002093EBB2|nr:KTSC domain-containing protein [Mucilaginibacter flavidus]MCO5946486.1 KTSC domain-containing protein [Mucilaginibacter flavidus]
MPSSVVAEMEYNEPASTLRITYTSGNVYDYKDVPPEVFEEMKEADSKGTFLNYRIKDKYRYKRVK